MTYAKRRVARGTRLPQIDGMTHSRSVMLLYLAVGSHEDYWVSQDDWLAAQDDYKGVSQAVH